MAVQSVKEIRASMLRQLEAIGGKSAHFVSRVNDYCVFEQQQRKLIAAYNKMNAADPAAIKVLQMAASCDKQKDAILRELKLTTENAVPPEDEDL